MYVGELSDQLKEAQRRHKERFGDGVSLFAVPGRMSHDDLIARIERAIAEGVAVDEMHEWFDRETREKIERGERTLY